ncbi:ribbon-helix-helix protein, CopG family [Polaromonas sp.]
MTQITLRISVDDLAKIDAEAKRRRISRAGFLRQAAFDLMGR